MTGLYLEGINNFYYVYSGMLKNDDSQKWRLIGSYIIHKLTGKVLESNSQGLVYLNTFNGGVLQYWIKYF